MSLSASPKSVSESLNVSLHVSVPLLPLTVSLSLPPPAGYGSLSKGDQCLVALLTHNQNRFHLAGEDGGVLFLHHLVQAEPPILGHMLTPQKGWGQDSSPLFASNPKI